MEAWRRQQQRGVILFVGVGLLVSGLLVLRPEPRTAAPTPSGPIALLDVRVIAPAIRDAAKVDLNTADVEELASLPGVGDVLAARIVAYRERYGPFMTIDDLDAVSGIGPSLVERVRDLATAGGSAEPLPQ